MDKRYIDWYYKNCSHIIESDYMIDNIIKKKIEKMTYNAWVNGYNTASKKFIKIIKKGGVE